jgi:hypothetical protein
MSAAGPCPRSGLPPTLHPAGQRNVIFCPALADTAGAKSAATVSGQSAPPRVRSAASARSVRPAHNPAWLSHGPGRVCGSARAPAGPAARVRPQCPAGLHSPGSPTAPPPSAAPPAPGPAGPRLAWPGYRPPVWMESVRPQLRPRPPGEPARPPAGSRGGHPGPPRRRGIGSWRAALRPGCDLVRWSGTAYSETPPKTAGRCCLPRAGGGRRTRESGRPAQVTELIQRPGPGPVRPHGSTPWCSCAGAFALPGLL